MGFGRSAILRDEAEKPAGGTTAPAAPAPVVTPPAAPAVDTEALKAEARKALLAELGIKDPEEAKSAIEAVRKAEEARLTEAEKQAKALKASLEEKTKAEAAAAEAKAEAKALREAAAMRDRLDAQGVAPNARVMVEALLSSSSKSKDFDESKFFEGLRKDHPTLFGAAVSSAPAPANTSPAPVTGTAAQSVEKLPSAFESRPWARMIS